MTKILQTKFHNQTTKDKDEKAVFPIASEEYSSARTGTKKRPDLFFGKWPQGLKDYK
jgi:hypothetical protein